MPKSRFHLASVEVIPLADRSFDRALTINTIHFWPDPVRALAEIRRVLRPDSALLVSAQTPEEAEKAPYTRHGFRIYDEAQLRQLHQAGFRRVGVELYRDTAQPWTAMAQGNARPIPSSHSRELRRGCHGATSRRWRSLSNPQCLAAVDPRWLDHCLGELQRCYDAPRRQLGSPRRAFVGSGGYREAVQLAPNVANDL